jgi:hypothetical protein
MQAPSVTASLIINLVGILRYCTIPPLTVSRIPLGATSPPSTSLGCSWLIQISGSWRALVFLAAARLLFPISTARPAARANATTTAAPKHTDVGQAHSHARTKFFDICKVITVTKEKMTSIHASVYYASRPGVAGRAALL